MDSWLICARAVHFAATLSVSGAVFFSAFVAAPAFRAAAASGGLGGLVRRQLAWIAWTALAVTTLSGAAWLVIVAQSMSGATLDSLLSQGVLGTVLLRTGFGRTWLMRFFLACLLAVLFKPFLRAREKEQVWTDLVVVLSAAGLVGSLAWAGHAVGALGVEGLVHPAADVVHLIAAAAWVGMLVPLSLTLAAAGRDPAAGAAVTFGHRATTRFSNVGVAAVAALLVTGSINTFYLADSVPALTGTEYGRLLLVKVALFLAMIAMAAINRQRLTPRLAAAASAPAAAVAVLRRLRRNTLFEVAAGALILLIVAALGVAPPPAHVDMAPLQGVGAPAGQMRMEHGGMPVDRR